MVDDQDFHRAVTSNLYVSHFPATRDSSMKYGLLWLLGVPIPVLIVIYLMFH
jgi:hypothetical protein